MSDYLLINIAIIAIPLILTFEKKIKFYKKLTSVVISIIIVGSVFVIWDMYATSRGDWAFNTEHILGIYIFNLPLEEILFFITVPYAIIFLYETALYYLKNKEIVYYCTLYTYASGFFILASLLYTSQYYTMTVLLFVGIFFLTARIFSPSLLKSKLYWQFILFTYVPFGLVNYLLTSIPIVTYSEQAIWGIRILTIPAEDFFYSFALLSFYLLVYTTAKTKWLKRK